jgi:hypothetical protein
MNQGSYRTVDGGLPERVAAALAVAEIQPSKLGPARRFNLSDAERAPYLWILRASPRVADRADSKSRSRPSSSTSLLSRAPPRTEHPVQP